jgi:hypothetical protein
MSTALKLPSDPYCEVDLQEDSEVDAAELDRFAARGGSIRENGLRLTVTGAIVLAPRRSYRRGDVSAAVRRRDRMRGRR